MDLRRYFLKKKAIRLGVKINDMALISRSSIIYAEAPCSLGSASIINPKPEGLVFGAHSFIRSGVIENTSHIGRFCSFGQNVTLGQSKKTHPIDFAATSRALCQEYEYSGPPTVIGNDLWIGDGAVIMEGVNVGHGAIVGTNALVTRDVLPYQIVGGNPAKPIRFRFDTTAIENLLASEWWRRDLGELRKLDYKNVPHFLEQLTTVSKPASYPQIKITRQQVSIHTP